MKSIKLSEYDNLLKEWDYSKNYPLDPNSLTVGSSRKVFWICPKRHSYGPKSIYERTRTDGKATNCPYCANKKVLKGFNDLETWCSNNNRAYLLKEWDYSKNDKLPSDYVAHTDKKIWWICDKKHSYLMKICERTKEKGSNCPYCSNLKLLVGYNDLKTLFPDVAKEWDFEKNDKNPEDYVAGTHTRANWICSKCGNKWTAEIKERTYGGTGCPKCAIYYKTSIPEQAIYYYAKKAFKDAINSYRPLFLNGKEIDIFIPSINVGIEYDGRHWHKDNQKDLQKSKILKENNIKLIRIKEQNENNDFDDYCVIKSNYKDKLIDLEPVLNRLFDILKELVQYDLNLNIDIIRDSNFINQMVINNNESKSLLASNSIVLKEWDYELNGRLTPNNVTAHSRKEVHWICSNCGKRFKQSIKTKVKGGLMCESCSKSAANKKRTIEKINNNEIESILDYPELLKEWNDSRNPGEVAAGSDKKAKWKCSNCGHEFNMVIKNRTKNGYKCPFCHGVKKFEQIKLFE